MRCPAKIAHVVLPLSLLFIPLSQAQSSRPPFEIASIRLSPNQNAGRPGLLYVLPDGRLTAEGIILRVLILKAYDLKGDSELAGGPDWITTLRWDLDAQAKGNPGDEQLMLMLRSLLEDRLNLSVHREMRESATGPVQVLVIDSLSKPIVN